MPVRTRAQRAKERADLLHEGESSLTPSSYSPSRNRVAATPSRIRLEHQSLRAPMEFVVPPPAVEHPIDIRQRIRTMVFGEEEPIHVPSQTPPVFRTPEPVSPPPVLHTLNKKEKMILAFIVTVLIAVIVALYFDQISAFATQTLFPQCGNCYEWCIGMLGAFWGFVCDGVATIWGFINGVFNSIVSFVGGALDGLKNFLADAFKPVYEMIFGGNDVPSMEGDATATAAAADAVAEDIPATVADTAGVDATA